MGVYHQTILRDLGLFLHVPGFMAIASLAVSLFWGEYYAIVPFLITGILSLLAGQILYQLCRGGEATRLRHAMITAALSWGIIPLFGAIPFLALASPAIDIALPFTNIPDPNPTLILFSNPWNALFESFSGFTSNGIIYGT